MSKTILAEIDGWTPVIDGLAQELGAITALVFGRMWRFCQGEQGICTASLDTIASDLNLDKATIMRHAKRLCENGYLDDLTPSLRNVPHSYADTGKANLFVKISVAQFNTQRTVAHSNATLHTATVDSETVAHSNKSVAESKLKIQSRDNNNIRNNGRDNSSATAEEKIPLTEGLKFFLKSFGAVRFKNLIQRDLMLALEKKHGTAKLKEFTLWAAKNGMTVSKAVAAAENGLQNWGKVKVQPIKEDALTKVARERGLIK